MDDKEKWRQTKEAWRLAREEMRAAFRSAWQEAGFDDSERRESFDAFVQRLAARAREFGREVGEDARQFGKEFAHDARKQADEAWKEIREDWRERQREPHRHHDWHEHWLFGGRRFGRWAEGDEEANPFLSAMLSRGSGLLSVYVLNLLAELPRHGNDLMKEIERRTLGGWTSNPGAVYPLLSNMESNGLVVSNWEEPDKRTRRIYQITDKGREELARLKQTLRPKLMDTIDVLHDIYDDLYTADNPPASGEQPSADTGAPAASEPEADKGQQANITQAGPGPGFARSVVRLLAEKLSGANPRQAAV